MRAAKPSRVARRWRLLGAAAVGLGASAALVGLQLGHDLTHASPALGAPASAQAFPLAVLGDSNSHSYQDHLSFPAESPFRGGPLRAYTLQWTEVLSRMRASQVDLGPWVTWGRPGSVARAREWLGLSPDRAPAKEDYLFNFANSGASCENLMGTRFRQVPRLVSLMDRDPQRWARGVVVLRIGANDWAGLLDVQARDPKAPELIAAADRCLAAMRASIELIHRSHPKARVLVWGLGNEADDPAVFDRYLSPRETANIDSSLRYFNQRLRDWTSEDTRLAFFDEYPWFQGRWGSRGADGKPAYRPVRIGRLEVQNTAGNLPEHLLLDDHHYGLAINALMAQAVAERLASQFGLPIEPIDDLEVGAFVSKLADAARAADSGRRQREQRPGSAPLTAPGS